MDNEGLITCYVCDSTFPEKSDLTSHFQTIHFPPPPAAVQVSSKPDDEKLEEGAIASDRDDDIFSDTTSFSEFDFDYICFPSTSHNRVDEYACAHCTQQFPRLNAILDHLDMFHPLPLSTEEMESSMVERIKEANARAFGHNMFLGDANLQGSEMDNRWEVYVDEESETIWEMENMQAGEEDDWVFHRDVEDGEKDFLCGYCDNEFMEMEELQSHLDHVHPLPAMNA